MILFVSGESPPAVGGVGDYTYRLRSALAALGWPSHVLGRDRVGRWDARALVWLLRTAPKHGVVHIQFQAGAYDLLGDVCLMPSLLRVLRPRVRVVTTFHDARVPYLFPRAGQLRRQAVSLLARSSHAVIAADAGDLVALGGPSARHHQVPIGSNIECSPPPGYERAAFRAALGLEPETLGVVYFGLLNSSKRLDLLLDAFEIVLAGRPDARLLLLGAETGASDPTDRQTAARIQGRLAQFGGRILRSGWLQPTDLSAHLLAGDVALLPYADGASARRGSLLACAEHGLPIVSSLPATAEVTGAIRATRLDADVLAAAVLEIGADPDLARRLSAASRTLAQRTGWPAIAAAHIAIYERLAASPRTYTRWP